MHAMNPPDQERATTMPEFDVAEFITLLEASVPLPTAAAHPDTEALVRADASLSSVSINDVQVAGPHGEVPVRLYIDHSRPATAGLVWVHGGGFVGGDLDMPEAHWVSLYIASRGIPVASVDYKKALHGIRYPVPLDEVFATWLWATGPEHPLGAEVETLHFGGASAGANLATATTLRLRDEGFQLPASLILAYPLVHAVLPPLADDITAALAVNPPPVNFTPRVVQAFNENYTGADVESARYAFPGDVSLAGLPAVRIVNAEADELRASGELFARQLTAEGVDTMCLTQMGSQHGFLNEPNDSGAIETIDGFIDHINASR